jgi:hypothetical protein
VGALGGDHLFLTIDEVSKINVALYHKMQIYDPDSEVVEIARREIAKGVRMNCYRSQTAKLHQADSSGKRRRASMEYTEATL